MTKRCGHLSHNPTAPAGTAEPLLGTLQGNPELLQVTLSFIPPMLLSIGGNLHKMTGALTSLLLCCIKVYHIYHKLLQL
jgi:hypothetical protein